MVPFQFLSSGLFLISAYFVPNRKLGPYICVMLTKDNRCLMYVTQFNSDHFNLL